MIEIDPIQSLDEQAKQIELAMMKELRGGQAGDSRCIIGERCASIRTTLAVADVAARKMWSDENAGVFTREELGRQSQTYYDMTRQKVTAAVDEAKSETASLRAHLEKKALPQRPKATFAYELATQEAELAGKKADMRMVLDKCHSGQVAAKMAELLERAVKAGDGLGTWLLGGSDWAGLYLESRGLTADEYQGRMTQVLEAYDVPEATKARQQLAFVTSTKGLAGLMMLTENVADMRLERVAQALRVR
jgi:hypothetical protein